MSTAAKFKVGDKVRVIPLNQRPDKYSQHSVPEQTFIVKSVVYGGRNYYYKGDVGGWGVWEENLVLAEPKYKIGSRVKITNRKTGQFLTGRVDSTWTKGVNITPDGSEDSLINVNGNEWDIEPFVELPTQSDSYIRVRNDESDEWRYYRRDKGKWVGNYTTSTDEGLLRCNTDIEVLFVPEIRDK